MYPISNEQVFSYNWCGIVVERLTLKLEYPSSNPDPDKNPLVFLLFFFRLFNWAHLSHFLSDFDKLITKLFRIACSFNWYVTDYELLWKNECHIQTFHMTFSVTVVFHWLFLIYTHILTISQVVLGIKYNLQAKVRAIIIPVTAYGSNIS